MSVERYLLIALDEPYRSEASTLHALSAAALARVAEASAGDRSDVVRHERAQSDLEALALAARNAGAPSAVLDLPAASGSSALLDDTQVGSITAPQAGPLAALSAAGFAVVEVPWPFAPGPTPPLPGPGVPTPPARPWNAKPGQPAAEAMRSRFRHQLELAAATNGDGPTAPPEAINPSGIANRMLTETLRHFAAAAPDRPAVHVPVRYRDGSTARPFPIGVVPMAKQWDDDVGRVLRFALLSIRHVELDAIVDGAWLRNTDVSRARQMAQTDELVYAASREQLDALTTSGPVTLLMYQTGLEPAVVGLYRAVADHLLARPGSVAVRPRYYQAAGGFADGTPWRSL